MSTVQRIAQIFGVVFILVSILGFLSPSMHMGDHMAAVNTFPLNGVHNTAHLLFGIWGLAAARSFRGARLYGIVGGLVYLALAGIGAVRPDGFGIMPIGMNDVWLHTFLGAVLAISGLTARPATAATPELA